MRPRGAGGTGASCLTFPVLDQSPRRGPIGAWVVIDVMAGAGRVEGGGGGRHSW